MPHHRPSLGTFTPSRAGLGALTCALTLLAAPALATPPLPNPLQKAPPHLVPSADGKRVYDASRNITWLADANLAASETFGVPDINPSGSMDYKTALAFVAAMNKKAYLGRTDWTLPATRGDDKNCDRKNVHHFGYGCKMSPLVNLYRAGFGLEDPQTAVRIPPNTVKNFRNFQPYLYWAGGHNVGHDDNENGMATFSFNNGFQGANVSRNRLYALPMVVGRLKPDPKLAGKLQAPYVVYDAKTDITWLADANFAQTEDFGVEDITPNGSMRHATAEKWVAAMNRKRLLGTDKWQLPRSPESDTTCSAKGKFGFNCRGSDLGSLYYGYLGLQRGTPVVKAPDSPVGPFHDLEPYLYWSCHAAPDALTCNTDASLPAENFGWSFSFGNGFQGTTLGMNELYVLPYHPGRP